MRITTKGQVTIPQRLREEYGLLANTEVEFIPVKGGVKIVKAANQATRGEAIQAHIRRHPGTAGFTTDEIMRANRAEE